MKFVVVAKADVSVSLGPSVHLAALWSEIAREHEVSMVLASDSLAPELREAPFEVRLLPASFGRNLLQRLRKAVAFELLLGARLLWLYLRDRPDALYLRDAMTLAPYLMGKLFGVPVFTEINDLAHVRVVPRRSFFLNALRRMLLEAAGKLTRGIITVTERQRDYLINLYGLGHDHVEFVANGADLRLFVPMAQGEAIEKLSLDPACRYLLWSGGVRPTQDMPLLLEGFARVAQARADVRLIFLSPQARYLEGEARARGLSDRVLVRTVAYQEVPVYLGASDASLATLADHPRTRLLSHSPFKVFEAMASGRPLVTARFLEMEFVAKAGAGLLYEPGDVASFVSVVLKLLDLSDAERIEMGRRGRAYVEEHHNWSKAARETVDFIRRRTGTPDQGSLVATP